ncbi:MAG: hypothetical protein F4Z54_05795, partial [Acidimicrobiaceae bacterium]|nr:hypothetical protein [Acidimicrobiaceae bacterium]
AEDRRSRHRRRAGRLGWCGPGDHRRRRGSRAGRGRGRGGRGRRPRAHRRLPRRAQGDLGRRGDGARQDLGVLRGWRRRCGHHLARDAGQGP